jgi:hypothetical protein
MRHHAIERQEMAIGLIRYLRGFTAAPGAFFPV